MIERPHGIRRCLRRVERHLPVRDRDRLGPALDLQRDGRRGGLARQGRDGDLVPDLDIQQGGHRGGREGQQVDREGSHPWLRAGVARGQPGSLRSKVIGRGREHLDRCRVPPVQRDRGIVGDAHRRPARHGRRHVIDDHNAVTHLRVGAHVGGRESGDDRAVVAVVPVLQDVTPLAVDKEAAGLRLGNPRHCRRDAEARGVQVRRGQYARLQRQRSDPTPTGIARDAVGRRLTHEAVEHGVGQRDDARRRDDRRVDREMRHGAKEERVSTSRRGPACGGAIDPRHGTDRNLSDRPRCNNGVGGRDALDAIEVDVRVAGRIHREDQRMSLALSHRPREDLCAR